MPGEEESAESKRLRAKREVLQRLGPPPQGRAVPASSPTPAERADADEEWELVTRRLCLIKDTGHSGTLWGGTMMSWIDEAGAIYAGMKASNERMVTKVFSELDFQHPVKPGDFVDFYGRVVARGATSLRLAIRAVARRPESDEAWEVITVEGVFVAVDAHLRKTTLRPKDAA